MLCSPADVDEDPDTDVVEFNTPPLSPSLTLEVLLNTPPSPLQIYPPNPVSVCAIVIVLLPSTRIELLFEAVLASGPPRLIGMPLLAVAAGLLGWRVMPSITRTDLDITMGMKEEGMGEEGIADGRSRLRVGKVMLWAVEALGALMMRMGTAVDLAGEREIIVEPRVIAREPGRRVMGAPSEGVKTTDEAEGVMVIGTLPIVATTGVAAAGGGGGVTVGKMMLWAIGAPGVLIMMMGAAVGLAGEREMMVEPGRVIAGEPGRRVIGGPTEGIKRIDEAEGVMVIALLPIVAINGVADEGGRGTAAGVWLGLEDRSMVIAEPAGCALSRGAVGATINSVPLVVNERIELATVTGEPPGTSV